jgi:predicted TIM-barrel fold metal-dependent hydrolase
MIDCHLHIGHLARTPDHTLAHIRGLGCAAACILPIEGYDLDDVEPSTEAVLDLYSRAPDIVIPFASVDPRTDGALRRLESLAAAGCRGFGEQKVRVPVDDPRNVALYRLAGELGLPVTVHLEEHNYNTGVLNFERLLADLPGTTFIGHAQSFWAYLEPAPEPVNGYPSTPIPEPGPTMRWLLDYPNLYGDLSAGSGLNALTRDEVFTREMLLGRAWPKLLWATDCPCTDGQGAGWEYGCTGLQSRPAVERLAPSPEAVHAVLHGNAARLFSWPAPA